MLLVAGPHHCLYRFTASHSTRQARPAARLPHKNCIIAAAVRRSSQVQCIDAQRAGFRTETSALPTQPLAANWLVTQCQAAIRTVMGSGNSAHGAAFFMAACLPPGFTETGVQELMTNRCFWVGFWGWFTAQFLKVFTHRFKKGVWDWKAWFASGGMPSSHSALCAAVTSDIALQYGLGSPMFALGLCFSAIVMYDAAGVRRHAGKQAEVLNQVVNDILSADHPVRISDVKLKEVLGHTPRQVVVGALLGVAMGIFHPMPIVRL